MIELGTSLPLQMEWACTGVFCLIGFIPLIINILIAYWMYKDAEKRNENGALWAVIGFFLSIIGLVIWIVVRPDMSEVRREEQMKQQQWQQQQPPPQQPQQETKQCSDCGDEMRYIDEYDRWYCDNCQEYK